MSYPVFQSEGYLTSDGKMLVEWIEAQYTAIDLPGEKANLPAINSLSGPIAEYYSIVYKTHAKTPETWVRDFPQSARNAYDIMKYVEGEALKQAAKDAQVQENTEKNAELENKFAKLQESIAAQVDALEKQNADLQAKLDALATLAKPEKTSKKKTAADTDEGDTSDKE